MITIVARLTRTPEGYIVKWRVIDLTGSALVEASNDLAARQRFENNARSSCNVWGEFQVRWEA